ncbi:hypothetical protein CR513_11321, partial [Mucuna pruriens]
MDVLLAEYTSRLLKSMKTQYSKWPSSVGNILSGCFEYDLRNRPIMTHVVPQLKVEYQEKGQGVEIIISWALELQRVQIIISIICGYTATGAVLTFVYTDKLTCLLLI